MGLFDRPRRCAALALRFWMWNVGWMFWLSPSHLRMSEAMRGGIFAPYPFHKSVLLWLGAIANASSEVVAQKFRGSKLRVVFS